MDPEILNKLTYKIYKMNNEEYRNASEDLQNCINLTSKAKELLEHGEEDEYKSTMNEINILLEKINNILD